MRDPQEPHDRLPRFQADAGEEAWFRALNDALASADLPSPPAPRVSGAQLPIVYIVGAPRSGTTLLSQVLSRYLAVGYINNLIARFWARPSVGIRLSRALLGDRGREALRFESEHGATAGVAGPHEFGYFWRHWLRLDTASTHHLDAAAVQQLDAAGLRRALEQEILESFGAPVVFKNLICGFQAGALARIHPQSLFLHITRDTAVTCASILASRAQRYGRYDAWWSLKPSTYPEIQALSSPCAQVARQVGDSHREVAGELAAAGVRRLSMSYESLCANPRQAIADVADALGAMGSPVEVLGDVPKNFETSAGPKLPAELDAELRKVLSGARLKG